MEVNLYLNPYFEKNESRRKELEICLENNLDAGFDNIHLLIEEKDLDYISNLIKFTKSKFYIHIVEQRPRFQEYIDLNNFTDDSLAVVMNSDIYIEPLELQKLKSLPWKEKKLYVPLSRWQVTIEGAFLLDRSDSADTMCFYGHCDITNADCPLGIPGIENSLAWKFKEEGYQIANVSRDIQIFHLHSAQHGNNYRENGFGPVKSELICKEPYTFHEPMWINQIK